MCTYVGIFLLILGQSFLLHCSGLRSVDCFVQISCSPEWVAVSTLPQSSRISQLAFRDRSLFMPQIGGEEK